MKKSNTRLGRQLKLERDVISSGSRFSECGTCRYTLWRLWGIGPVVCFICLNPSSADSDHDDATVKKCGSYARRWGYSGVLVLNALPFRGTDPAEAFSIMSGDDLTSLTVETTQEENLRTIEETACTGRFVDCSVELFVAAWGNNLPDEHASDVLSKITQYADVHCLGSTKKGKPKHPSRLPLDLEPELFEKTKG